MTRSTGKNGRPPPDPPDAPDADAPDDWYVVGPGRPPKEYQFRPGQSGNPLGARRKASLVPDLKAVFERALSKKVMLRQGEKEHIVTMATAGIEQLITQFAKGDRHARRDVFALAQRLGVDLRGRGKAIAGEKPSMTEAEATALTAALGKVFQLNHHEAPAEDVDPYGDTGGEVVALQPIKPKAEPEQ
jgi:Family of unknown function (DUF5681)